MSTLPDSTFPVLRQALTSTPVARAIVETLNRVPGVEVPIDPALQQIFKGPTEALSWRIQDGAASSETYPWPMPGPNSGAGYFMGKEAYEHSVDEATRHLKEWPVFRLDASNGFIINTMTEEAIDNNQAMLALLFSRLPWTGARLEIVGFLCIRYFRNPGRPHTDGTCIIPLHLTGATPSATIVGCDPDEWAVEFSSSYGSSHRFDNEFGCVRYDNFAIVGRPKAFKVNGSGGQFSFDNIVVSGCSVLEDEEATPKQFDRTQYAVELYHMYGNGAGSLKANYNRCNAIYVHECNAVNFGLLQASGNAGTGITIKHCRDLSGHVHAEYNYNLNVDCENATFNLNSWHEGNGFVGGYYAANTDLQPSIEPGARMVMCAGTMHCDRDAHNNWDLDAHSMRLVKFPLQPEHDNGCAFLVTEDQTTHWRDDDTGIMAVSSASHWINDSPPTITRISQLVHDITFTASATYEPKTDPNNLWYRLNPGWTADAPDLEIGDLLELQITIEPQNQDTWDFVLDNEIEVYLRAGEDVDASYYTGTDQVGVLLPATRYQAGFKWRGTVQRPAVLTIYAQSEAVQSPRALLQFPYGLSKAQLAVLAPTGEDTHVYRVEVVIAKVHR